MIHCLCCLGLVLLQQPGAPPLTHFMFDTRWTASRCIQADVPGPYQSQVNSFQSPVTWGSSDHHQPITSQPLQIPQSLIPLSSSLSKVSLVWPLGPHFTLVLQKFECETTNTNLKWWVDALQWMGGAMCKHRGKSQSNKKLDLRESSLH